MDVETEPGRDDAQGRRVGRVACGDGSAHGVLFPEVPAGWYYLCHRRELAGGPVGLTVGSRRFVGFLGEDGAPTVLDAVCSHMGTNLANGEVIDGCIRCPVHGWRYSSRGECVDTPALAMPPMSARQTRYPVADLAGNIFFYNHPTALHPMPFYEGERVEEMIPSPVFEFISPTPWYMVASNGFDVQHFRFSHDRTLVGEPEVDQPDPFALRCKTRLEVTGEGLQDRLTRAFAGPVLTMTVTVWSGTVILVRADFRRTTTFGLVNLLPLTPTSTRARFIVWKLRRRGLLGVLDPLEVHIKRLFVREFLRHEAQILDGLDYRGARLTEADAELGQFKRWLTQVVAQMPGGSGCSRDALPQTPGGSGD